MELDKVEDEVLKELGKVVAKEAWEKKNRLLPLLDRAWAFLRCRPAPVPQLQSLKELFRTFDTLSGGRRRHESDSRSASG